MRLPHFGKFSNKPEDDSPSRRQKQPPNIFIFNAETNKPDDAKFRTNFLNALQPPASTTSKSSKSADYSTWVPMTPQSMASSQQRGLPPDFAENVLDLEMLIDQDDVDIAVVTRLNQLYVVRNLRIWLNGGSRKHWSITR